MIDKADSSTFTHAVALCSNLVQVLQGQWTVTKEDIPQHWFELVTRKYHIAQVPINHSLKIDKLQDIASEQWVLPAKRHHCLIVLERLILFYLYWTFFDTHTHLLFFILVLSLIILDDTILYYCHTPSSPNCDLNFDQLLLILTLLDEAPATY